ncbi:reverse transcriptase domain-containing protein [Tanacetum coccineum]|uniref:Reverse transcriptase domain-containing protein n=1 Tax=Tanacetum coccineum TaxID=301880 RepID=A0ABQ4YXH4_9ASTR
MDGCTKGPQLEEDENLNTEAPKTGRTPPGGTSAPAGQVQGGPSPAFVKENIDVLRTMIKELDNQGQEKVTPRKLFNEESGYDTVSDSSSEDLSMPYRRPKPMPFTSKITRFRYHRRAKLPPNVRVYEGNKDPEDHLSIFSAAAEQEEWPMPVWCKMFCQTLSGSARNWFDSLDPKSVDGFEELSNKFLEEFSQQKKCDKDPREIHGIKRKPNKGLQAFMDRFKAESAHIKGVPSVLRISAFMHRHGHPELAKKLNDKIPKTVDEMWERVRAFIKGETAADTTEVIRSPRREGFTPLTKTPKEILAMDNVNFSSSPPMVGTLEKQNMNTFYDYHQDRGHNTNDCYHLKKQIKEAVASRRLAHLVKDIRQGGQKGKGSAKGKEKVINMLSDEIEDKRISNTTGGVFRRKFAVVKSPSPYNALRGRTGMTSLGAVASTIHSMIKFPTLNGIATVATTRETLRECKQIEEAQALSRRACVTDPTPMQTISEVANPRVLLASVETRFQRPGKELMQIDDMEERRQLDKRKKPPSLTPADMTGIPRAITEHSLDTYPHIKPKVQKKRSLSPDRRKVVTDEVNEWLKAGIIRRV